MAKVVITMKIMPESPDVDLEVVETEATKLCSKFGAEVGKKEIEPVAFGLKALILYMIADEEKGGTDDLEEGITKIKGVNSVEVTGVTRALG